MQLKKKKLKKMLRPRIVNNYKLRHKKGKPVSKEKWENLMKTSQLKFDKEISKKPLSLQIKRLSKYRTVYNIFRGKFPRTALEAKSFYQHVIQFTYDTKHQRMHYTNASDRRGCKMTDTNWGNLYKACEDIASYEWTQNNVTGKHVLQVDTQRYIDMEILAKWLIKTLKERKQIALKNEKQIKSNRK